MFIVGGGPSLVGFDWSLLHGRATIGVNFAYRHGVEVCSTCFFSDRKWFDQNEKELAEYPGDVFTHCRSLLPRAPVWLKLLTRHSRGLFKDALCFGHNSGCGAVNLALMLGARRVLLLGFDCQIPASGKSHWHNWRIQVPKADTYRRFLDGWKSVADTLPHVFPGREIINLCPSSAIPYFPKHHHSAFLYHAQNDQRVG